MARETKAQREARKAAEMEAYYTERANTYLQRLMNALEAAGKENFELTVKDGKFVVSDLDLSLEEVVKLPLEYSNQADDDLDDLEYAVNLKTKAREESNRKYMMKQAALAKLSKEERVLLGL